MRDNDRPGAGDHDTPFWWGNPRANLTMLQYVHALFVRSRFRDLSGSPEDLHPGGTPSAPSPIFDPLPDLPWTLPGPSTPRPSDDDGIGDGDGYLG